jgi:hypothetical protein
MNARILVSLLIAALGVTYVAGAPESPRAVVVRDASSVDGASVVRGSSQWHLREALGPPTHQLSGTVWQYEGYHTVGTNVPAGWRCSILIVTLADGRVADMKLVNRAGATLVAASAVSGKPLVYVVDRTETLVANNEVSTSKPAAKMVMPR